MKNMLVMLMLCNANAGMRGKTQEDIKKCSKNNKYSSPIRSDKYNVIYMLTTRV
jgi:hypothetical protein